MQREPPAADDEHAAAGELYEKRKKRHKKRLLCEVILRPVRRLHPAEPHTEHLVDNAAFKHSLRHVQHPEMPVLHDGDGVRAPEREAEVVCHDGDGAALRG